MARYAVIIAAAGAGQRFGQKAKPFGDPGKKPYAQLDGRPLFLRAIELFANREDVCQILLAVDPGDLDYVKEKYGANLSFMGVQVVAGGARRCQTVANALQAVKDEADYVAVHDAARVCTTADMIDAVFAEAVKSAAAILAAPLTGTIKQVSGAGVIEGTVPRAGLYEAQTPQVFAKAVLRDAYARLKPEDDFPDDAAVVEAAAHAVHVVSSDCSNLKITFPGDLALAAALIKGRPRPRPQGPRSPFEEAQW